MIPGLVNYLVSNSHFPHSLAKELLMNAGYSMKSIRVTKHPLGFVHFDLSSLSGLDDGGFARVHFWDRSLAAPDPAGNIHDHTWHLTSAVLLGALRDRTYTPYKSAEGAYSAIHVRYGEVNSFEPAGRHDLFPVSDRTYSRGDIYRIPSRMVHESEPSDDPTITFVVGIPDADASVRGPLILSRSDCVPTGTPTREEVPASEAMLILSYMQDLISE